MMTTIYFNGQLECVAYIQNSMVIVPEDYTMNQLVTAIRSAGYVSFMTKAMRTLVKIK